MKPVLSLKDVTKIYGGVIALNHISFELRRGEILGLVGENGAGKSTLIKTLSGAVIPDAGIIEIEDQAFPQLSPALSRKLGISVVYQELTLCPALTVYENIFLGSFKMKGRFVDQKAMVKDAQALLDELGIKIDPKASVSGLSVAYMQLIEIAKAASNNPKILIFDEPTGPLTAAETEILFALIRRLKERGTSIIYISHRLSEIFDIADRVTIMRDGHVIETHLVKGIDEEILVKGMIGRELTKSFPERHNSLGEEVLRVENLSNAKVKNISFTLRKGEVLGVGGLVGAGRTEMARSIFAADPKTGGKFFLEGKEVNPQNPREAVSMGITLVPEDRKTQGVVLAQPIANNINMSIYEKISKWFFVNEKNEKETADRMISHLKIKTPSRKILAGNLSGGNQQKVVLAKCLAADSKVLIFDEPTRGIDVGAKQEFYKLINDLAENGLAIIMISSEMDELLGMSDRIMVLSEGRFSGILSKEDFSQENVFKYATANQ